MVNILAWSDIRKEFRITADTNEEPVIRVHLGNGEHIMFRELKNGLYLGDVKEIQQKKGQRPQFCEFNKREQIKFHPVSSQSYRESQELVQSPGNAILPKVY